MTTQTIYVSADSVATYHVFVKSDVEPNVPRDLSFILTDNNSDISSEYESVFITKGER